MCIRSRICSYWIVVIRGKSSGVYDGRPFQLSSNDTTLGWTAAVDSTVAVSSRVGVLLPLRFTFASRFRDRGVRHLYIEAGAGLELTLSRRVY